MKGYEKVVFERGTLNISGANECTFLQIVGGQATKFNVKAGLWTNAPHGGPFVYIKSAVCCELGVITEKESEIDANRKEKNETVKHNNPQNTKTMDRDTQNEIELLFKAAQIYDRLSENGARAKYEEMQGETVSLLHTAVSNCKPTELYEMMVRISDEDYERDNNGRRRL